MFGNILEEWTLTIVFHEIHTEKPGIKRCKPACENGEACTSVCLMVNSSRNNSSVDEVSSQLLHSNVLSINRAVIGRSIAQVVDKADS